MLFHLKLTQYINVSESYFKKEQSSGNISLSIIVPLAKPGKDKTSPRGDVLHGLSFLDRVHRPVINLNLNPRTLTLTLAFKFSQLSSLFHRARQKYLLE